MPRRFARRSTRSRLDAAKATWKCQSKSTLVVNHARRSRAGVSPVARLMQFAEDRERLQVTGDDCLRGAREQSNGGIHGNWI
jgi:hypothetical protein